MGFDPYNIFLKIKKSIEILTPKMGVRSVEVHSLTLSYTFRNMKCDSWASLLARTFVSLCLGHERKVKVVTIYKK
jgi:hypothetical protein